jgi:hypothetical protein
MIVEYLSTVIDRYLSKSWDRRLYSVRLKRNRQQFNPAYQPIAYRETAEELGSRGQGTKQYL